MKRIKNYLFLFLVIMQCCCSAMTLPEQVMNNLYHTACSKDFLETISMMQNSDNREPIHTIQRRNLHSQAKTSLFEESKEETINLYKLSENIPNLILQAAQNCLAIAEYDYNEYCETLHSLFESFFIPAVKQASSITSENYWNCAINPALLDYCIFISFLYGQVFFHLQFPNQLKKCCSDLNLPFKQPLGSRQYWNLYSTIIHTHIEQFFTQYRNSSKFIPNIIETFDASYKDLKFTIESGLKDYENNCCLKPTELLPRCKQTLVLTFNNILKATQENNS